MKQSEVKEFATEELKERIAEQNALYTKMKLNHAVAPLENPLTIRDTRRTIARLKTELNARIAAEAKK